MLFRTTLIAASIVAMAAPVNAQQSSPPRGVRIITPYSEHIYRGLNSCPMMRRCDNKTWKVGGGFKCNGEATTRRNGRRLEGIGAFIWPDRRQRRTVRKFDAGPLDAKARKTCIGASGSWKRDQ